jgi:hypothetical protein
MNENEYDEILVFQQSQLELRGTTRLGGLLLLLLLLDWGDPLLTTLPEQWRMSCLASPQYSH